MTQHDDKEVYDLVSEWLNHVSIRKELTATEIAKRAGLSPSLVLRAMGNHKRDFVPLLSELEAVASATGLAMTDQLRMEVGLWHEINENGTAYVTERRARLKAGIDMACEGHSPTDVLLALRDKFRAVTAEREALMKLSPEERLRKTLVDHAKDERTPKN